MISKPDILVSALLAGLSKARLWRQRTRFPVAAVVLVLATLVGCTLWALVRFQNNRLIARNLSSFDPSRIRVQLERSIHAAYERDAATARNESNPEFRQKSIQQAAAARDRKLSRLEAHLEWMRQTIASGQVAPEYLEMTRSLQEQGVDPALDYLSSQQSALLDRSRHWATRPVTIRQTLAPLLEGVLLYRYRGDLTRSEWLCRIVLADDAEWSEARHQHVETTIAMGERALSDERPMAAWQRFEIARMSAEWLVQLRTTNPVWQRDLSAVYQRLGELGQQLGQLDAAREFCEKRLSIAKRLAADDASDPLSQRDLSNAYLRAGELCLRVGRSGDAEERYQQGIGIAEKLSASDRQAQQDLALSLEGLADMNLRRGRFEAARQRYERCLDIRKRLAAETPDSIQPQRDLSETYEKLAMVAGKEKRERKERYQQSLDIRKKLAASRPDNTELQRELALAYETQASRVAPEEALALFEQSLNIRKKLAAVNAGDLGTQRELWVAYERVGAASLRGGRLDEARGFYKQELDLVAKLASTDSNNSEMRFLLGTLYDNLGDVCQRTKRFDEARDFYQRGLDIRAALAVASPTDVGAIRNLGLSYRHLGDFAATVGDFATAFQTCDQGYALLDDLSRKSTLNEQLQYRLADLKAAREQYRRVQIATGPLNAVLLQPADLRRRLLVLRIDLMAHRREIDRVAETANALALLEPKTPANLYAAACAYGRCAKFAAGWSGQGLFPPPKNTTPTTADREKSQQYARTAVRLLQQVVTTGKKRIQLTPVNPDLEALRDSPEFNKLVQGAH